MDEEMGSDRQRREALGVGLLALGVLVALALVSGLLGAPEGRNLVGPAGRWLSGALFGVFGPAALLIPVLLLGGGVHCLGVLKRERALLWSAFGLAALVLFPPAVWLTAALAGREAGAAAGWLGRETGTILETTVGLAGGLVFVLGLLTVLAVLTLGWSPSAALRVLGDAARTVKGVAGRGAAAVGERARQRLGAGTPRERRPAGSGLAGGETVGTGKGAGIEAGAGGPRATGESPDGSGVDTRGGENQASPALLSDPGDLTQTDLPPLELLTLSEKKSRGRDDDELERQAEILIEKLASFRVDGEIRGWTTGPVVTQFEVVPAEGVKVGQIAARADDLALAMKAPSVRIVAPIPGKGAVGVEVPNPEPEVVYLREILESGAYRRSGAALPLALGRDLEGSPYCADLARMPHLLIAGATGSGKSVCIHGIITSLLYRYTPRELRLVLIDPKMVELSVYEDLPHLRHDVVTDNEEAATALRWAQLEMQRRYELLSESGSRSVRAFNRKVREGREIRVPGRPDAEYGEGELPYVVLVIDELADLMMTVQGEVEGPLAMLAQKARAVGIHLVIATQRPSVNVITGLIKANFPSRIAFRVASKTDSRTILDQNGAESLLGNGDMLFLPPGEADPVRIQGAYLTSRDTERLVEWYRQRAEAAASEAPHREERDILEMVEEKEAEEARVDVEQEVLEDRDELFRQAAEIVVANDSGSTSLLQRRLRIGYGRAARIVDQLHHAGIVGPSEGSKAREVLVTMEELDEALSSEGPEREGR